MGASKNWREIGVKAGKTEGWMNLEETLVETRESHPSYNYQELVQADIDGWEETDHFQMLYGNRMMDDAKDSSSTDDLVGDAYLDKYLDSKEEFWEGYLQGRKSKGRDIYALAKRLVAPKKKRSTKKAKPKKKNTAISLGGLR